MADINIPIAPNIGSAPTDLGGFVSQIVGIALIVAAIATFVFLVFAGLQWITAGGDKGKVEEARNRITGAIVGLVIVAVSWAVFLIIDQFFGLGIAGGTTSTYTNTNIYKNSDNNSGIQGVCITSARCANGPAGSNFYCQNPNYTARAFRGCGTNMVYCDCVPR